MPLTTVDALVLALAFGLTTGPGAVVAGQPSAAATPVRERAAAIPIYARVSVSLRDGRRHDGYLVARTPEAVSFRIGRAASAVETVQISDIASIRLIPEDRSLSRGQRRALVLGIAAGVVVAVWAWVVKTRALGT